MNALAAIHPSARQRILMNVVAMIEGMSPDDRLTVMRAAVDSLTGYAIGADAILDGCDAIDRDLTDEGIAMHGRDVAA